jgi:hypothetical protein
MWLLLKLLDESKNDDSNDILCSLDENDPTLAEAPCDNAIGAMVP